MSSLTRDAIEKIEELVGEPARRIVEINGHYHTYGKFNKIPYLKAEAIKLSTLDGFIKYVNDYSKEAEDNFMVVVDSHLMVSFRANAENEDRDFEVHAHCEASNFVTNFKFDREYDPEEFMIKLQTGFVQTPERDNLIKVAGSMSGDSESRIEDDGITQSTTVGRAVKTKVQIKNPVTLKPFRTFQEIDQIASPFIFRIGRDMDISLYEGDSGGWKLDAMREISKYLKDNLNGVEVYA